MQSRQSKDAEGVDISHWQGAIDWQQVADGGITFAYMKATESGTYVDPKYRENAQKAKAAGILRGAYHFARPGDGYSADDQANHFIDTATVNGSLGELPPALDLEDAGGLSKSALAAWVRTFVNRVEMQTGRTSVLYVSPGFANSYLDSSLHDIALWVANWGVSEPPNFDGWTKWDFWQYSNRGSVPGISGPVDRDVYADTSAALRANPSSSGSASVKPPQTQPKSKNDDGQPVAPAKPTVSTGSRGSVIVDLQLRLYRAGENPGKVDGDFGPNTLAAVKAFQRAARISVDGIVGPVTWAHLDRTAYIARPEIERGSVGTAVQAAQYLLQYRGAKPGAADSIFGPNTEAAVKRYQRSRHLHVDGIVGPVTWSHLTQP